MVVWRGLQPTFPACSDEVLFCIVQSQHKQHEAEIHDTHGEQHIHVHGMIVPDRSKREHIQQQSGANKHQS